MWTVLQRHVDPRSGRCATFSSIDIYCSQTGSSKASPVPHHRLCASRFPLRSAVRLPQLSRLLHPVLDRPFHHGCNHDAAQYQGHWLSATGESLESAVGECVAIGHQRPGHGRHFVRFAPVSENVPEQVELASLVSRRLLASELLPDGMAHIVDQVCCTVLV